MQAGRSAIVSPAKRWVRIYQTVLVTGLVTIATLPVIAAMGGGVFAVWHFV